MLVNDAILDSSTEKMATGVIHSVSGHSTGIQYRMHMNTTIETLWERMFSSVRIQYQYTVQDTCECYLRQKNEIHDSVTPINRQVRQKHFKQEQDDSLNRHSTHNFWKYKIQTENLKFMTKNC